MLARAARIVAISLVCAGAIACSGDAPAADAGPDAQIVLGCPSLVEPVGSPGEPIDDDFDNFAAPFFAAWCTRCHSSTITVLEEREFAPLGLDWDDEAIVRDNLALIRRAVGVLNFMPFNEPFPSCAERLRFITWIDSGAP